MRGWFFALIVLVSVTAGAADPRSFEIEDIRVEGLQRISAGTVFNYLPLEVGDRVDEQRAGEAVRALFGTGFFEDVRLERADGVLVVVVAERPSIASIDITGNESIDDKRLRDGLKQTGLAEGRIFDRSLLEQVEQELRRQYFSRGKYGVRLDTTVTPLERNRVAIDVDIVEGEVARIRRINVVGNDDFADEELKDLFELSPPSLFSFYTHNDRYSKQKLQGDLESLRSFYLDNGYINFNIKSTQVSLTPDRNDIYITINLSEGQRYSVSEVELAGQLVLPKEQIRQRITVEPGSVYSQKAITQSTSNIIDRLGNEGYAFANVNTVPAIDEETKEVKLTFFVDPGRRVYVRRVNFSGNYRTQDRVLRREVRQMEGGWFSTDKIQLSRKRLNRLGFFDTVNVETPAVAESTDQVDVDFSVKERLSGSLQFGVGFSQSQGVLLNASVTQDNVLGTGKRLALTANTSEVNNIFDFSWTNPYYTLDGVSRTLGFTYRSTDAAEANLADWTTDTASGRVTFGVPLAEFETVRYGLELERTSLDSTDFSPDIVFDFLAREPDTFNLAKLTSSWTRDTRNRAIFPDRGVVHRVSGEVAMGDLGFYKARYGYERFFGLVDWLTLSASTEVGFGNAYGDTEKLPFFENFFAGGPRSVRGFEDNTLGPRDPGSDDPIGGNLRVVGNLELLFPPPLGLEESMRLSAFVDAGNVYDTESADFDFDAGELRYSAGVGALWLTPVGALRFSLAMPLNDKPNDETQVFQFTLGSPF